MDITTARDLGFAPATVDDVHWDALTQDAFYSSARWVRYCAGPRLAAPVCCSRASRPGRARAPWSPRSSRLRPDSTTGTPSSRSAGCRRSQATAR